MKHTKGPWVFGADKEYQRICIDGPNSRPIAQMPDDDTAPNALANARLIAAAPELLEACKRALSLSPIKDLALLDRTLEQDGIILDLLDAVAKAEGREE